MLGVNLARKARMLYGAAHAPSEIFSTPSCGWRMVVSPIIPWDFPSCYDSADARSGRSFHPLHRDLGPLTRTWRRPLHRCGVASPQAPTPDPESLPAPIAESIRDGPHPRRSDGALDAVVDMKQRNPRWGCPRIAQQIALAFHIQ